MCLFQFWFPQGICPVIGLLGRMVVSFPVFKGISILFSVVVVSVCTPTRKEFLQGWVFAALFWGGMWTAISGWDIVEKWGHFSNWISQKSFFQKLKEESRPGISLVGKHLEEKMASRSVPWPYTEMLFTWPCSCPLETLFIFWRDITVWLPAGLFFTFSDLTACKQVTSRSKSVFTAISWESSN